MRIVLTGATGFIGKRLAITLLEQPDVLLNLVSRSQSELDGHPQVTTYRINEINSSTIWVDMLKDCEVVIHAAGRAHIMQELDSNPLEAYREINAAGTLNLARQAAHAGVKRFIFLSSIKVNGDVTGVKPFHADDIAMPSGSYGISKYEAEQGLFEIAKKNGIEVVIIRPVLVYGPGVKGNFQQMIKWLKKGIPLPLGAINNRRSFVAIDNLIDLIKTCIHHPNAANQIFLVSDGHDISTTELLKKLSCILNTRVILFPCPKWFLKCIAALLGKTQIAARLCDSLQVDISNARELLNWQPILGIDDALKFTIEDHSV